MIRFRPLPGLTAAALLGIAALIGLGIWQLHRLEWKRALIAAAQTRAHIAPVDLAGLVGRPASAIEYTHARARGAFLAGEVFLFSKTRDGRVGFQVIAPFRLESGQTILVDRGFVAAAGTRNEDYAPAPGGARDIVGLVRAPQTAGPFTPKPDAARRIWYAREAGSMARALGLSTAPQLFLAVDAGAPGARPQAGMTRLTFRNDHLEYALTWFSLAGVLVGVYFAYHRSKGRLRF